MAILSASVLEEAVSSLLKASMLPCAGGSDPLFEGPYAPLGSFSAKIDLAARLGLLSTGVSQSLHLVRRIRNDFAHGIASCSFEANAVRGRVLELKRLNDVAKPERRAQFPPGPLGDFQVSVSWLVYWIWHLVAEAPRRCPECGRLHPAHAARESHGAA